MVSYLNPFSENFILKGVIDVIGNILNYINPFSEDFLLKDVLDFLGNILSYINPFSENFILKDVIDFLGNILSYINPFSENFFGYTLIDLFGNLLNSLFVMTPEQEQAYEEKENSITDIIESKFGIFYFFQEELEKADEYVYNEDFLNIHFEPWSFNLGIINFTTPEINFTEFRDVYEPYRTTVRNSIFIIFVGLAIVYIVKYVLNYGVTGSDASKVVGGGKDDN